MADYTLSLTGAQIDAAFAQAPKSRGLIDQDTQTLTRGTNISSVTDQAVGQSNIGFTTNFDASTWSHTGMGGVADVGISTVFISLKTTSTCRLYCFRVDIAGYQDTPTFGFSFRGDFV